MAHYQDWNPEKLSRAGMYQEEGTYINTPEAPMRPISSFTPINQGYTNNAEQTSPLARTIEPLRTLRNTNIYDLPEDVPILPTPGGIKRPKPRSKNGRAKTMSGLESSNNVGAEDCDSGQFEVSSPKRRKVPIKGAQPAFKIPSKVQSIFASEGLRGLPNDFNDGPPVSQLTTPPDTHKKSKKRVSSAMVSKRKKSSDLFQSSGITKPSLSTFKSKPPRDQSQSINRLQGFITTEEQLKLNSNGIANTTLQKLATFRYVPRDDNSSSNQPIIASKTANTHGAFDQYDGEQTPEEPNQVSLDYRHLSSDSFFEEALWIPKQFVESNELEITHSHLSQNHYLPGNSMTTVMQQISDHVEYSPKQSEYAPISSEARVLENLPDDNAINVIEVQEVNQGPPSVNINAVTQLGDMDPELADHRLDIPRVYVHPPSSTSGQEQTETSHDSILLMPTARHERYNTNIQVERSDIEDGELASMNPSPDYFDSDNFDDDIGDEDLLALVTDTVIPKAPMLPISIESSPPSKQPKYVIACTKATQSHRPVTLPQEVIGSGSSSIVVDEEDDFPMDAGLEEEILRLAEASQGRGVVESFEPPRSLRLPSDSGDTDREVYDNTLQFSPPMSRESDPSAVARVQSNGLSSPSKPPATNEDADWGYITSTAIGPAKAPVILPPEILAPTLKDKTPEKLPSPVKSAEINSIKPWLDDSHEYLPLAPFARPKFPSLVHDRCPVNGLSTQIILRVCFRIGEMLKEGGRCNALGQDAIVELFARVNFSSREPGTSKQHFQFSDLFHDRPPFAKGILANFKTTGLAESESKVFIESSETLMARCLGRVKKDVKNGAWLLHIINVRVTDWEEIRWTKRIVCGETEEKAKTSAKL
ncbi:hypothetical protein NHQ30_005831 [Ciborinia camelliae]|nr:hypothetical protein NHQ30_005831 [Ciborinia camelliae]